MDAEKFKLRMKEVASLMVKFRTLTDKSDKRICRDLIRAMVKELTRV